jgi:LysM repeat protein
MVMSLTLTGCLRQAAEPFESETSSAPIATLDPNVGSANPTATLPLIFTVSAPTADTSGVGVTPESPDTSATQGEQPLIVTIPSTPTDFVVPTVDAPTSAGSGQNDTTFITPGSPLNPTIIDTPLPTLAPSPDITPTTLGNPGGQGENDGGGGSESSDLPDDCIHIVESGDTLFNIALAYDTSLVAIRSANPDLAGDIIQPGEEIQLPNCEGGLVVAPPTRQPTATAILAPGSRVHVVATGETLFVIAQRYGTTVDALVAANNLSNPNRIDPGQELIIP